VCQLFDDTGLGDPLLVNHATDGDHGETAVHDLIDLVFLECDGVLAQAQWVKAKVTRLALAFQGLLQGVAADGLKCGDEKKDLRHTTGVDVVLMGVDREHLREVGATKGEELWDDETNGCEHANATVLDLGRLQKPDVDVVRKKEGVEFEGSRKTFEVLWLEEERYALAHLHGDGSGAPLNRGDSRGKGGTDEAAGADGKTGGDETNHSDKVMGAWGGEQGNWRRGDCGDAKQMLGRRGG